MYLWSVRTGSCFVPCRRSACQASGPVAIIATRGSASSSSATIPMTTGTKETDGDVRRRRIRATPGPTSSPPDALVGRSSAPVPASAAAACRWSTADFGGATLSMAGLAAARSCPSEPLVLSGSAARARAPMIVFSHLLLVQRLGARGNRRARLAARRRPGRGSVLGLDPVRGNGGARPRQAGRRRRRRSRPRTRARGRSWSQSSIIGSW